MIVSFGICSLCILYKCSRNLPSLLSYLQHMRKQAWKPVNRYLEGKEKGKMNSKYIFLISFFTGKKKKKRKRNNHCSLNSCMYKREYRNMKNVARVRKKHLTKIWLYLDGEVCSVL